MIVWVLLLGACSETRSGTPYREFLASHAAKAVALRSNLPRAAASAVASGAADAPRDCAPRALVLNGKQSRGNAEVFWSDEVPDILAGTLVSPTADRHLVPRFLVGGWCQLLDTAMYWLEPQTEGARALEKSGVGAKVAGWIDSALDLTHVIILVPGEATRGTQKVALRVVELATGTVTCASEVTATADPSLGVEYYQLVYKSTGQKVGGPQAVDKYSQAMKVDLEDKLRRGLGKDGLNVDLRGFCTSAQ